MSRPEKITAFAGWLTGRGAEVLPPTSPWEVLRVRCSLGVLVAYRNKNGVQKWPSELENLWERMAKGENPNLSPIEPTVRGRKTRHRVEVLLERDGPACFYCDQPFSNAAPATIEHFVPVSLGGPDHFGNQCLACERCNHAVGNRPVADKIRYRDSLRGGA